MTYSGALAGVCPLMGDKGPRTVDSARALPYRDARG